jgi:hypothetical protein
LRKLADLQGVSRPLLDVLGMDLGTARQSTPGFLPRSPTTIENCSICRGFRVSDGTRTRDRLDHNHGFVPGPFRAQCRLESGIRADRSGQGGCRYPARSGRIPVGFGPNPQAWGPPDIRFAPVRRATSRPESQPRAWWRAGRGSVEMPVRLLPAQPLERLAPRLPVVHDRCRIVPADHAAARLLGRVGHGPRLGQMLVGHRATSSPTAAAHPTATQILRSLTRRDSPARRGHRRRRRRPRAQRAPNDDPVGSLRFDRDLFARLQQRDVICRGRGPKSLLSSSICDSQARTVIDMKREIAIPDSHDPEPSSVELGERKRISDRAVLLDHIDYIFRPPAWVYEEIEEAIRHALAGDLTAEIESRDGSSYVVADLVERWELEELLEIYARPPDDRAYRA